MSDDKTVFDFVVPDLDGNDVSLEKYRGNVLLICNTASKGSNKKLLKGLYRLQEVFSQRPFKVLAFPTNQFMYQERKTNAKIRDYYLTRKNYTFDVFSKIKVNGEDAHPLYKWLKSRKGSSLGKSIQGNFTKFLIEADGQSVQRFEPSEKWSTLAWKIEAVLRKAEATPVQETQESLAQKLGSIDEPEDESASDDEQEMESEESVKSVEWYPGDASPEQTK